MTLDIYIYYKIRSKLCLHIIHLYNIISIILVTMVLSSAPFFKHHLLILQNSIKIYILYEISDKDLRLLFLIL